MNTTTKNTINLNNIFTDAERITSNNTDKNAKKAVVAFAVANEKEIFKFIKSKLVTHGIYVPDTDILGYTQDCIEGLTRRSDFTNFGEDTYKIEQYVFSYAKCWALKACNNTCRIGKNELSLVDRSEADDAGRTGLNTITYDEAFAEGYTEAELEYALNDADISLVVDLCADVNKLYGCNIISIAHNLIQGDNTAFFIATKAGISEKKLSLIKKGFKERDFKFNSLLEVLAEISATSKSVEFFSELFDKSGKLVRA